MTEPEPPRFIPLAVRPGIRRIVAPNPGPMTYHGTNTWLLEGDDGLTVIDPGPNEPAHIQAIADSGPIARIVLTHTHKDHFEAALPLQAMTGAPIAGWARPWVQNFLPDIPLADGDRIGALTAWHTPGHASDHLCFALADGTLFTGDHVMSWSTSIISPPDGDMGAYMASLRLLLTRNATIYLAGHGPALENPQPLVRAMLAHRATRESAVLGALSADPRSEADLVNVLYSGLAPNLVRAASRTVLAHLLKLAKEGRARQTPEGWQKP